MARKVRFFSTQIAKAELPTRPLQDSAPLMLVGPRAAQQGDELEVKLNEHESRLIQMNESYSTLSTRTRELQEARHVLIETAVFFDKVRHPLKGRDFWIDRRCFRLPTAARRSGLHSTMALRLSLLEILRVRLMLVRVPCNSTSSESCLGQRRPVPYSHTDPS